MADTQAEREEQEIHDEEDAQEVQRARTSARRGLLAVLGVLAFVVIGLIIVLNVLGPDKEDRDAPSLDDVLASEDPEAISVGKGPNEATVAIRTLSNTCWVAYFLSEKREACGSKVYAVTGSPRVFSLSVQRPVAAVDEPREADPLVVTILSGGQVLDEAAAQGLTGSAGLTVQLSPGDV